MSRSHRTVRFVQLVAGAAPFVAVVGLLGACSKTEAPGTAPTASLSAAASPAPAAASSSGLPPHAAGIAWQAASSDADVDAAFAVARAQGKPVFVYWGAKWCPPCNQVKATLFNRQDFIERSRAFVPVYVDGDSPGAQKLGARFNVSGYPTMVLFTPQGAELTRLPGEVEAERYTQVLTLGMNAERPVRDVLRLALGGTRPAADGARAGDTGGARSRAVEGSRDREIAGDRSRDAGAPHPLTSSDWRLLAFYAWDVDEQQLVPKREIAATLARLADACPPAEAEAATRLRLKALAAVDAKEAPPRAADAAARAALLRVLAEPAEARRHLDVLTNSAPDIVRALGAFAPPERAEVVTAFDTALKRFEADPTLSRADRIQALIAQVDLATIDAPKRDAGVPAPQLPDTLLADIREQSARADREITDGYERQAVITACAYLLEQAGLGAESDALLKANLAKSHSPYYLMSELAGNAKARGDNAEALRWYGEAFAKSEGPATRLQWGSSYLNALVDLAPADEAGIERTAGQVFDEAAKQPDAFDGRSGRALRRVGTKLARWNQGGAHAEPLVRLQTRLDAVCGALPPADPAKAACRSLMRTPSKPDVKSTA